MSDPTGSFGLTEPVELIAAVRMTGRSSVRVEVSLRAENLLTGDRRHAATAVFTMVSVGPDGRAKAIGGK
jgi:acyl-CoA hydrolase